MNTIHTFGQNINLAEMWLDLTQVNTQASAVVHSLDTDTLKPQKKKIFKL